MIRRRRRTDFYDTKTGHERWLVSYADFVTLLFAFFVVMYSVSQVSEKKYKTLSDTLSSVFDGKVPVDAQVKDIMDRYPLDDRGQVSGLSPEINLIDTETLASEVQQALIHLVDPNNAKITATEEWVQIEVSSNLLFSSGSASPSNEAKTIFGDIAQVLAPYDNAVEVAGYTDNIPISSQAFGSNWELSSARASSIVRLLEVDGVAPERLSAVGYGEHKPIADNQTAEGRRENRRVVLMVAKHQISRPIQTPSDLAASFPLPPLDAEAISNGDLLRVPAEESSEALQVPPPVVEPIRLKSGGLLFSHDPS